jgi:hypothetical protein
MKLSEIDPISLARTSVNKLRDHVARITFHLAPISQWREEVTIDGMENTDVGQTIMQLAGYAKSGALGDWPDATCAVDAATNVCTMFYTAPGIDHEFVGAEITGEADPETELGLIVTAAIARAKVSDGTIGTLNARELASLAGLTYYHVTRLMTGGELQCSDAERGRSVTPEEAGRWLRARGVEGV